MQINHVHIMFIAMALYLPACGQVCVGDVCFGYPDETGGDEEDPPSEMWCFNRDVPEGSRGLWCLDDESLVNKLVIAHYLMADQAWPDEPWLGWSDDYCGEVLLDDVGCFGDIFRGPEPRLEDANGRVMVKAKCDLCWPFESDDPIHWQFNSPEGPVGMPETIVDGEVIRVMPSDWLDPAGLQPSWGYGATAICGGPLSDGNIGRVECNGLGVDCSCPCDRDADCPQNFGEGICELDQCTYSHLIEPPEPAPVQGVLSRYACCSKDAGGFWGCFPWREELIGDCGKWPTHGVFWAYIDCEAWVGPGSKAGMCSGFTDLQPDLCCSAP